MMRKAFMCFLLLFLLATTFVFAQDENFQPNVDYKVNKMKILLKLTDTQADSIAPIIKDYLIKKSAILQEVAGEGIVDHVSVKETLKALKEHEYQKLSKILSEEQMKKWINKENLMATLNPDSAESTIDDGPSLTADGANFKF